MYNHWKTLADLFSSAGTGQKCLIM